jgi:hypothetical protein
MLKVYVLAFYISSQTIFDSLPNFPRPCASDTFLDVAIFENRKCRHPRHTQLLCDVFTLLYIVQVESDIRVSTSTARLARQTNLRLTSTIAMLLKDTGTGNKGTSMFQRNILFHHLGNFRRDDLALLTPLCRSLEDSHLLLS